MKRTPWLLLVLATAACAAPAPLSRPELVATMDALIGTATCDSDAQCRTIGVGARPCGGPAGYRPWSTTQTDATQLKAAADALASFDRAAAAREGLASDCRMRPDPGAVCRPASEGGKRCQLGTASSALQARRTARSEAPQSKNGEGLAVFSVLFLERGGLAPACRHH